MADVTVSYKGSNIVELDDSATKTLTTSGKYCEGDITIDYVKPSGGQIYGDNEVIFYDYDGTIVYSCTIAEAHQMTAQTLPVPPEHEGLIFQEWNYTLEEITTINHIMDIGAIYDTYEERTDIIGGVETTYIAHPVRIYLDIPEDNHTIYTQFGIAYLSGYDAVATKANKAMIDWGDGSSFTVSDDNNVDYYGNFKASHVYTTSGSYVISIYCHPDNLVLVNNGYEPKIKLFQAHNTRMPIITDSTYSENVTKYDWIYVNKIEFGSICGGSVKTNTSYMYCPGYNIKEITLSKNTIFGNQWYDFEFARGCRHINIPRGTASIARGGFANKVIESISLPNTITSLQYGAFFDAKINRFVLPDSVTSIEDSWVNSSNYHFNKIYISSGITSYVSSMFFSLSCRNFLRNNSQISSFGDSCFRSSNIDRFVFSADVTSTLSQTFYQCPYLKEVIFEGEVASIDVNCFRDCSSLTKIDLSHVTSVPTLSNSYGIYNFPSILQILVPQALLPDFQTASNWSSLTNYLVGV